MLLNELGPPTIADDLLCKLDVVPKDYDPVLDPEETYILGFIEVLKLCLGFESSIFVSFVVPTLKDKPPERDDFLFVFDLLPSIFTKLNY